MSLSPFSNITLCIFAGFTVCEGLSIIPPTVHFHPSLSPPAEYVNLTQKYFFIKRSYKMLKHMTFPKNAKEVKYGQSMDWNITKNNLNNQICWSQTWILQQWVVVKMWNMYLTLRTIVALALLWWENIWQLFALLLQDPDPLQFSTIYSTPNAEVLFIPW